jgi:hypothetical protein
MRVLPASIIALTLALLVLDRVVLPQLESQKCFWGAAWSAEDKKIFKLNCLRNWASKDDPLFRTHLIQPGAKQPGPRILVMGDSYVWGDGYANPNDLWWRQLARELRARGYDRVDVVAAGYPGYSTDSETRAAAKLIAQLKPSLVVFGYSENDADEELVPQAPNTVATMHAPGILRKLLPNISEYWTRQIAARWQNPFKRASHLAANDTQWELRLLEGENFVRFSGAVGRLGDLLRSTHTEAIVVTLPKLPDAEYYGARFSPVRPLFERAQIPFVDLTPNMIKWYEVIAPAVLQNNPLLILRPLMLLQVTPANAHPSAALAHFYAERTADFIEQHYRALLGPRNQTDEPRTVTINDCAPIFAGLAPRTAGGYEFEYPPEALLLTMPIRKPFVQLNLEDPVAVRRVELNGANLRSAQLFLTTIDPRVKADIGKIICLPEMTGTRCVWNLTRVDAPVNTVMVHATFKNSSTRKLSIQFN